MTLIVVCDNIKDGKERCTKCLPPTYRTICRDEHKDWCSKGTLQNNCLWILSIDYFISIPKQIPHKKNTFFTVSKFYLGGNFVQGERDGVIFNPLNLKLIFRTKEVPP